MTTDTQLTEEQSRKVAAAIREELARRRISRQHLAEQAKLSLSTLEKALGGRRPFTLATTVRIEQALGVSLRKADAPAPAHGAEEPGGKWRRRRARQSRRLFAPRGHLARGQLCHAAPVLRREGRHLRLPHRDRLGHSRLMPRVPRARAQRRGVCAVRRGGGAQSIRPHLSRHQPPRPAPPDHRLPPHHHRRDVRHPDDAAVGPRLSADADRSARSRSCRSRISPNPPSAASARTTRTTRRIASICRRRSTSRSQCSWRADGARFFSPPSRSRSEWRGGVGGGGPAADATTKLRALKTRVSNDVTETAERVLSVSSRSSRKRRPHPRPLPATRLRFATPGGGRGAVGGPTSHHHLPASLAVPFEPHRTPRATHHRCVQNSRGGP